MRAFVSAFVASTLVACTGTLAPAPSTPAGGAREARSAGAAAPGAVPLYEGLGTWSRKVTTRVPAAQRYFDQGLAFVFAFNHDEAIRSFARAAELDPSCAMAHWGVALANGPHINNAAVDEAHARAARAAVVRAGAQAGAASVVERALIAAQAKRYAAKPSLDRRPLDEAYAAAMREVWREHPEDADVGALFAEAAMDLRPWDLWTPDGGPQPGTSEIVATLEAVLARAPAHPLANHLYVHAVEASPAPERADAAADRLRDLVPGLGHMVHMPSHIDVRRGRWREAIVANERAIEADRLYLTRAPRPGFYTLYVAHNHHMLAYAAMMRGESARAVRGAEAMLAAVPKEVLADPEMAAVLDGYLAMPLEVRLRFGRWDEVLAAPPREARFPFARALQHHARGVAFAAKGDVAAAEGERTAFLEAKRTLGKDARFGNNAAAEVLAVAEHLLAGELAARAGKMDAAIEALREAVRREDALRYDEPPDWILPARHALGAVLVKAGRAADAEAVYREDLRRLPGDGWALVGLARSLKMRGRAAEAAASDAAFRAAWADADVEASSSCLCQPFD